MTVPALVLVGQRGAAATIDALIGCAHPQAYSYGYQTVGQSIPSSAGTFQTVSGWAGGATVGFTYSGGVWTCQQAGFYLVVGQLAYPNVSSPAGQRVARLVLNGTAVDECSDTADANYNTPLPLKWGGNLAVGDTVTVQTTQSQGIAQLLASGAGLCHVSLVCVAPT